MTITLEFLDVLACETTQCRQSFICRGLVARQVAVAPGWKMLPSRSPLVERYVELKPLMKSATYRSWADGGVIYE